VKTSSEMTYTVSGGALNSVSQSVPDDFGHSVIFTGQLADRPLHQSHDRALALQRLGTHYLSHRYHIKTILFARY